MSAGNVITLEDVSFAYDGRRVLDAVGFTVAALDFVGIVGPNGGGKTTLLKLVLGLLEPTCGRVRLFGDRPATTRHRVGYVPQHFSFGPHFPMTVADVVLTGRLGVESRTGQRRAADRAAVEEALASVQAADLAARPFHDLSGGQQQRVLIARALASSPEMLILDEPTANVDATVEDELYGLLRRLNDRMTILMVSHDLGFVAEVVKSVLCVHGQVAAHPTCDAADVNGDLLRRMYGHEVKAIRHDQKCQEGAHECQNS